MKIHRLDSNRDLPPMRTSLGGTLPIVTERESKLLELYRLSRRWNTNDDVGDRSLMTCSMECLYD
jgi:hypothetical protein